MSLYSNPEKFGLETIKELDDPNASYSFDKFVIWRREKDNELFYATDSGCSCPSPFENVKDIQDLTPLKDMKAFEQELTSWGKGFFDAQTLQDVVDKVHVIKLYKCTIIS
jgi:hypothetical protein